MIDIKPFVAQLIGTAAAVELSYHPDFRQLPVIVMTETGNQAEVVLEGADRISRITVQLDIYADTASETESIAAQVNAVLTAKGFKRSFSEAVYNEDKPRRCMRFICGVDEAAGRIVAV